MPKKTRHLISASASARGNPKVGMVQAVVTSDSPTSVPKDCPGITSSDHTAHAEPALVPIPIPNRGKGNTGVDRSSDSPSQEIKTEASDSWDAEDEAGKDFNGAPSIAPTLVKCHGPFTCFSCGRRYKYKSRYDKHRKACGDVVDGVLSSCLVAPSFPLIKEIKTEPRESSLEKSSNGNGGHLSPSLGCQLEMCREPSVDQLVYCCSVPYCGQSFMEEGALREHQGEHLNRGTDDRGNPKRRKVENVLEDQAVTKTFGSNTAKSLEPNMNSSSMIQISNVMSLGMSQDEFLPMKEEVSTSSVKAKEPVSSDPSSESGAKHVAPRHKAWRKGKRTWRNVDKLTDKLTWRAWVQRCLRNRTQATPKWLHPGGRRALCPLCGMRFIRQTVLNQHIASAHHDRFHYRCCNCNMSFKLWTCLCRHVRQAHSVKIQRISRTSEVTMAMKCYRKSEHKDFAKLKFIHNVQDTSMDDESRGRLVNDETRQNSYMKKIAADGSPRLCLFAIKDIKKGQEIVFNQDGDDLPLHTSTQSKTTQTLRTYSKNEGVVLCALPGQKISKDVCLSHLLAQRTKELESERTETEVKFSAMEERHKADIASLQSDLRKQILELTAANQKLTEELAAARTPAPETPQPASTPPTSCVSSRHPDMVIPELKPERERKISQLSEGRSDRYGCYLFQAAVGTKIYHTWCCNTNWSGAGGKWGLPRNLQEYLLNSLAEKFPGFGYRETRMFIERINELLRKPRQFFYV